VRRDFQQIVSEQSALDGAIESREQHFATTNLVNTLVGCGALLFTTAYILHLHAHLHVWPDLRYLTILGILFIAIFSGSWDDTGETNDPAITTYQPGMGPNVMFRVGSKERKQVAWFLLLPTLCIMYVYIRDESDTRIQTIRDTCRLNSYANVQANFSLGEAETAYMHCTQKESVDPY
jgi:hypothetical protein